MKLAKLNFLIALGLVMVMGATGCKKHPKGPTPIPGQAVSKSSTTPKPELPIDVPPVVEKSQPTTETALDKAKTPHTSSGIATSPRLDLSQYSQDREVLKTDTVYFDFDRSEVKIAERVKVEEVATYMKGQASISLLIEGHCDERGTEEYNRALGERRALAVREYLVNLGVSAERVFTISYGLDRPAEQGHSEAAWAKNRRGEFVVLHPKQ